MEMKIYATYLADTQVHANQNLIMIEEYVKSNNYYR
jgi:hypothetical protein